tara:strand:+ start:201 stop:509 length:309 start_codon:yes stop_codon:yes gene_type:complete
MKNSQESLNEILLMIKNNQIQVKSSKKEELIKSWQKANDSEKEIFEFQGEALKSSQDKNQVGVWTDGCGFFSDNGLLDGKHVFCDYKLTIGKTYRVSILEIN